MQFEYNKSLALYNSFGFEQSAERYIEVNNDEQLNEVVEYANSQAWPVFIIGGGSNLILTQNIAGLVVRLTNESLYYENRGGENSWLFRLTAAAGINWHRLVRDTTSRGVKGLENLSLIPGTAGAAPVQNIGAYGVELADRFESLRALHVPTNQWHTFSKFDCHFSYRDSYFKQHRGEYIITSINLLLGNDVPFETHYDSLKVSIEERKIEHLTPELISDIVCSIRQSKLPDPTVLGNAGSFFHNPVLKAEQYEQLQRQFPRLIAYPQANGDVKLAAGWLIDSLGLRGFTKGTVGVHDKQALVLVNHGGGTGKEVLHLADEIRAKVLEKFGVELTIEPQII